MRICRTGLLGVFLFFAVSLCACDDSDSNYGKKSAKNQSKESVFCGIVRNTAGNVFVKYADAAPVVLNVGQAVRENSSLETKTHSSVVMSVPDGSVIKMDGQSEISLGVTVVNDFRQTVSVALHSGRLFFDMQKQTVKDEFEVRTENILSVVRGAIGFVENIDGLEVSSLKEGDLGVKLKSDSGLSIKSGQTLIVNDHGEKVLSLASSGTSILARAIDSIAFETARELGVRVSKLSLEKIESQLLSFDEAYKKKVKAFMVRTQSKFKPKPLNEYIGKSEVTLNAFFVPGMLVTVMGIVDTIPESGMYKRTFAWSDTTAFGSKRFVANCGDGEVEYICYTWNTNFVSAKMADVLTKADERKPRAVKDSVQQPKNIKPSIVIDGSSCERIHVLPEERDIPATLRFSIAGLMGTDLKQIKEITVKRKNDIVKTFSGDELTTNSFKLPIRLKQNRIAHIEVMATFVNGKKIKAEKIYETYCYFENYENGKKSNRVNDMTAEEEYRNVVKKNLLKDE